MGILLLGKKTLYASLLSLGMFHPQWYYYICSGEIYCSEAQTESTLN